MATPAEVSFVSLDAFAVVPSNTADTAAVGMTATGAALTGAAATGAAATGIVGAIPPDAMADTTADLLDAIVAVDGMMSSIAAYRARLIDQARSFSELSANVASLRSASPEAAADEQGSEQHGSEQHGSEQHGSEQHGSGQHPSGRSGGWDAATVARRELVSELASALRLPERTTETLIAHSSMLAAQLPATLDALQRGEISYRHAQSIADHASSLPADSAEAFEVAVLPAARTLTVARFERAARVQRERMNPESIEARHSASVADRSVTVSPGRDGMAWLTAYLPAAEAIAIHNRLRGIADSLKIENFKIENFKIENFKKENLKNATEQRTRTQLMTDVFIDLLVDGEISSADGEHHIGRGIRATVLVTVPALALLGLESPPASLEGFGPIDAETARELAATAPGFTRILTHPETGAVLSVGRDRYSAPADLRRYLRVRDETCRFPGCGRLAVNCDLDHTVGWHTGGPTDHDNLAHLCQSHHHLKHHTRWSVVQLDGGVLQWTSPLGRTYTTNPAIAISTVAA